MAGKKFLGRDAILAVKDIQQRELFIQEWDTWVIVRGLSGKERDEFETSIMVGKGKNKDVNTRNMRAKLIVRTVVDAAGQAVFSERDVETLGEKSASALEKIFDVARELSGLTEQDTDELLKNSESGQPDASPSV